MDEILARLDKIEETQKYMLKLMEDVFIHKDENRAKSERAKKMVESNMNLLKSILNQNPALKNNPMFSGIISQLDDFEL